MFEILVASGSTGAVDRPWGARAVSLVVHSALIAAAIGATRHPPSFVDPIPRDVPVYLPGPVHQAPALPAPAHPGLSVPVMRIPGDIPTIIPDPTVPALPGLTEWPTVGDTSRPGPGTPGSPGSVLVTPAPIDARFAEEPPVLLGHPVPRYPELLRAAGIEGRVVVEVVLDTLGRAEPATLRIATSAHPLFDGEASVVVLGSRYRPGRVAGRPVRVRIRVPVSFGLRR
jgi:protein TonB